MKNKQIVYTRPNVAELLEVECAAPAEDEVVVETVYSTISSGTEKANITGDTNVSIYSKENEPAVFPRATGYSSSGVVIAKGSKVKTLEVGDRVAMSWSFHKKVNVINENKVVKFDDEKITMQAAALSHIGTFPMGALRKVEVEIGESLMVMGLGVLGLMAVSFAKAAGAVPVIAVDPIKERREKALKFGADFAFDPFEENFAEKVRKASDGGINAAIEVTGVGTALNQCLDCMARFGRIALLGCTRDKNFTVDYYRKVHGPGIKLVGAHTMARPSVESSPDRFTERDDVKTILKLVAMNRINLEDMIDEVYSPNDCAEVYTRLINDKAFPAIAQFDWREIKTEE